jgi:hypothetical protein
MAAPSIQSSGTAAAFISLISQAPFTRTKVSSEFVCAAIFVCCFADPKTFEVQVCTIAFHGVADAESWR